MNILIFTRIFAIIVMQLHISNMYLKYLGLPGMKVNTKTDTKIPQNDTYKFKITKLLSKTILYNAK